ncbi:hypothetical protein RF11_15997 [Thelohanellus kitauei]|uniref:Uncharacterized protein n=1 Tax=Thelohanellus kitauei TaxID=669202 RepID=A0A0C2JBH0_THEKT|nr:hypothetical protein RF11_15997 [Thelohanellus kitauei]
MMRSAIRIIYERSHDERKPTTTMKLLLIDDYIKTLEEVLLDSKRAKNISLTFKLYNGNDKPKPRKNRSSKGSSRLVQSNPRTNDKDEETAVLGQIEKPIPSKQVKETINVILSRFKINKKRYCTYIRKDQISEFSNKLNDLIEQYRNSDKMSQN